MCCKIWYIPFAEIVLFSKSLKDNCDNVNIFIQVVMNKSPRSGNGTE